MFPYTLVVKRHLKAKNFLSWFKEYVNWWMVPAENMIKHLKTNFYDLKTFVVEDLELVGFAP